MFITEMVKTFLRQPEDVSNKESSKVKEKNTLVDLSNNDL